MPSVAGNGSMGSIRLPGDLDRVVTGRNGSTVNHHYRLLPPPYFYDANMASVLLDEARHYVLRTWEVVHTLSHGTRYRIDHSAGRKLNRAVLRDQGVMQLHLAKGLHHCAQAALNGTSH